MTVLEFLALYASLFLTRAEAEGIPGIQALYGEDSEKNAYVHVGNQHGGTDIIVGFPLAMEMNDAYQPELTEEQWDLFKENIRDTLH